MAKISAVFILLLAVLAVVQAGGANKSNGKLSNARPYGQIPRKRGHPVISPRRWGTQPRKKLALGKGEQKTGPALQPEHVVTDAEMVSADVIPQQVLEGHILELENQASKDIKSQNDALPQINSGRRSSDTLNSIERVGLEVLDAIFAFFGKGKSDHDKVAVSNGKASDIVAKSTSQSEPQTQNYDTVYSSEKALEAESLSMAGSINPALTTKKDDDISSKDFHKVISVPTVAAEPEKDTFKLTMTRKQRKALRNLEAEAKQTILALGDNVGAFGNGASAESTTVESDTTKSLVQNVQENPDHSITSSSETPVPLEHLLPHLPELVVQTKVAELEVPSNTMVKESEGDSTKVLLPSDLSSDAPVTTLKARKNMEKPLTKEISAVSQTDSSSASKPDPEGMYVASVHPVDSSDNEVRLNSSDLEGSEQGNTFIAPANTEILNSYLSIDSGKFGTQESMSELDTFVHVNAPNSNMDETDFINMVPQESSRIASHSKLDNEKLGMQSQQTVPEDESSPADSAEPSEDLTDETPVASQPEQKARTSRWGWIWGK